MSHGIPVIFCGDFNGYPSAEDTYHFVIHGRHYQRIIEDWTSNGEEEPMQHVPLSHFFKLKILCGEPAYTNYVGGFHGCLVIFSLTNALEVEQVIPFT